MLREVPAVGTINMLVLVEAPLTDGALVYAVQTATEAKAQALADARHRGDEPRRPRDRDGDGLDLRRRARRARPSRSPGRCRRAGGAIARCVHGAVLEGALDFEARRRAAEAR